MAIYKITNKINGKIYIGRTVKSDPFKRVNAHFEPNRTVKHLLHKAIAKYGKQNFSVIILEDTINGALLNDLEAYYIDFYNCLSPNGYNLTKGGDAKVFFSEETLLKMKNSHLGHKSPMDGKTHTKEARLKISLSKKGKPSPHKGKSFNKPNFIIDNNGVIYFNASEASKYSGVSTATVYDCIKNSRPTRSGLKFNKFKDIYVI
jgi:group I intron endonuclease